MLFPRSHGRTPIQKGLIVFAVLIALALSGAGIYSYERYYRGPGDEIILGTWLDPLSTSDDPSYYSFHADHSFSLSYLYKGERQTVFSGRWYAGGHTIVLRVDEPDRSWPLFFHIVEISPTEMRVRTSLKSSGEVYVFTKADGKSPPGI